MGKITKKGSQMRSHRAKFCTSAKMRNFAQCKNFAGAKFLHPSMKLLDFSTFSTLLSFWFLICKAEFDSNSTRLDRLDNLGINSLQNYKISHKMLSEE